MVRDNNSERTKKKLIGADAVVIQEPQVKPAVERFVRETPERGASLVEYALLVALIAVVAIAAVSTLGRSVSGQFSNVNDNMLDPSQIP